MEARTLSNDKIHSSYLEQFENARIAQVQWNKITLHERLKYLSRFRSTLLQEKEETLKILSEENGKPLFEALASELVPVLEICRYLKKELPKVLKKKKIYPFLMPHRVSHLLPEGLGVTLVISPWNYPLLLPLGEILFSILCGNAVIFKPSEFTPKIGLKIQSLFDQAGFPKNLLQTILGDGKTGAALIEEKPAKIFFTGSVQTGKKIASKAGELLIPVSLELGGKDPFIVLEDADLDHASSAALWGAFTNSGQACASVERILVHENVKEKFVLLLQKKMELLQDGRDLGKITTEKQKLVYQSQLNQAQSQGYEVVSSRQTSSRITTTVSPTLIVEKSPQLSRKMENEADIFHQETFGPMTTVESFRTEEEAIGMANQTNYGLLASIHTKNVEKGYKMAEKIQAGSILINEVLYTASLPETPWSGTKNSGYGIRHSAQGIHEFVRWRHIHLPRFAWLPISWNFKSFWWFPYTQIQFDVFNRYTDLYTENLIKRARLTLRWIWKLIPFLMKDRRF